MKTTLEQPICKVFSDGTKHWYLHDKLHKLHRIDGPAAIYPSGSKHWYQNGKLHRINGPAIIHPNGKKYWYLNGKEVTQQDIMNQNLLILFIII